MSKFTCVNSPLQLCQNRGIVFFALNANNAANSTIPNYMNNELVDNNYEMIECQSGRDNA